MAAERLIVTGARETIAALGLMETALEKKVLRTAMREAARPILEHAKAHAPVRTGLARRSLKIRAIKRTRKGNVGVVVQTRDGDFKGDAFYVSFYEYGSSHQPARPFMRGAFDTQKGQALLIAQREIDAGIQKGASGIWKGKK